MRAPVDHHRALDQYPHPWLPHAIPLATGASPQRLTPNIPRYSPRRGIGTLGASGYAVGMDTLSFPLPNRLLLVIAPQAARAPLLDLAARLAVQGSLRVLDGGNQFNAYVVARAVRRQTANMPDALRRVRVARAFTCYQMASLLEAVPADGVPTLLLEPLSTFYDENVPLRETSRLLDGCLAQIRRLSAAAPVVAGARPSGPNTTARACLLDRLQEAAGQVWVWEQPSRLPPPQLF